jgi:hypothetical protein
LTATGNPATLYVETVRESQSVADLTISIAVDFDASVTCSDQVRVTAPRIELVGRWFGDTEFTQVGGLIGTSVDDPAGTPTPSGFTPGAYQTYKLLVYDPRPNLTGVLLDNQPLELTSVGGQYVTAEFIGLPPNIPPGTTLPPYLSITIAGETVIGTYNPIWPFSSKSDLDVPEERHEFIGKFIKEAAEEMEAEGWTGPPPPNTNAFGIEVHNRVGVKLNANNDGRWLTNVYVAYNDHPSEPFRKILSIGQGPPGGSTGTVQIDVLRLKQGYSPQVGDILDPNQLDDLYEIKTSAGGKVDPGQKQRLKTVRGGKIQISMSQRRWTFTLGWHKNPRVSKIVKMLGLVGLATSAYAIINADDYDDEIDEIIAKLDAAKNEADDNEKRVQMVLALNDLKNYLNHFDPSDSVNLVSLGMIYHILGNDW